MQKQYERSAKISERVLQRKGSGEKKAIKYRVRRLRCIEDYSKQVAASIVLNV